MTSSVFDSSLLQNVWSTPEMREVFSEKNRMQKWLDYEAALAIEQGALGIIPQEAADEIAERAKVEYLDHALILKETARTKHALVPTVRGLEHACRNGHGEYVHFGPTTQDVVDTGLMLQLKQAHAIIKRDLKTIGQHLYRLSEEHRNTPMTGRTLALQALPITFGHKAAIWLTELCRHHQRLVDLEKRTFVGSVVGAVGTKASFGEHADEIEQRVLARLGLDVPEISWQPARDRFVEFGGVLGMICGTLGKIGHEILLLAHNEFDELHEPFDPGQVGSSTMPHKRNPAVSENAVTVSTALKGNINLLQDMLRQEHERDGAHWKMEWKIMPEICLMTSIVLQNMEFALGGLQANEKKMRANMDILGGFMLSERVMFVLSDKLGKQTAHELIYEASRRGMEGGVSFHDALFQDERIRAVLTDEELAAVLDPTTYIGQAPQATDRALAAVRKTGWLD
ncbi:adenylosuccinate lyase [Consotaella aegiceratis]|uniref:adenylosuccinate lyase n=1 Tax=Consotaella aegiceratis TaxID=3097961 RepID=UPI002F40C4AB